MDAQVARPGKAGLNQKSRIKKLRQRPVSEIQPPTFLFNLYADAAPSALIDLNELTFPVIIILLFVIAFSIRRPIPSIKAGREDQTQGYDEFEIVLSPLDLQIERKLN